MLLESHLTLMTSTDGFNFNCWNFFVVARKSFFDNWFMVSIVLLSSYVCAREVTKHCSVLTLPRVPMFSFKIALCSYVPTVFSLFVPCLTYLIAIFPHHRHPPQRKFVEVYLFLRSLRQVHILLFPTIFLLCFLVPQIHWEIHSPFLGVPRR